MTDAHEICWILQTSDRSCLLLTRVFILTLTESKAAQVPALQKPGLAQLLLTRRDDEMQTCLYHTDMFGA